MSNYEVRWVYENYKHNKSTILSLNSKTEQTIIYISTLQEGIFMRFGHNILQCIFNKLWNFRSDIISGNNPTVNLRQILHYTFNLHDWPEARNRNNIFIWFLSTKDYGYKLK